MVGLDPTDKKILDELSFDCRLSYRDLAKRVGLSTTAVIRRVNALIDDGTIHNFVVIPTRNMAGVDSFIAIIHTESSENLDEFVSMIGSTHKFVQVSQLIGPRGRSFFLTGGYTDLSDLMEIGRFLRALDGVEEVEIYHTERKLKSRGGRLELTRHHLLVLRALKGDARKQVAVIADETELSMKQVRRALRQIRDSGAFHFTARRSITHSRGIDAILQIRYDEGQITVDELWQQLKGEYPNSIFDVFRSSTGPIIFVWFEFENLQEMVTISKIFEAKQFVQSIRPLVVLTHTKFPWPGEFILDKMIEEKL